VLNRRKLAAVCLHCGARYFGGDFSPQWRKLNASLKEPLRWPWCNACGVLCEPCKGTGLPPTLDLDRPETFEFCATCGGRGLLCPKRVQEAPHAG
jgi:hypothetical protein